MVGAPGGSGKDGGADGAAVVTIRMVVSVGMLTDVTVTRTLALPALLVADAAPDPDDGGERFVGELPLVALLLPLSFSMANVHARRAIVASVASDAHAVRVAMLARATAPLLVAI